MPSKRTGALKIIEPALGFFAFIFLWELATWALKIPSFFLSAPSEIFQVIFTYPDLLLHFSMTFYEAILGLFLALTLAMILALMIVHYKTLEIVLYPLLIILPAIPEVAFAPIFVLLFGTGPTPKIILVFLHSFFPILVNMISGLSIAEPELIDLLQSLRANKWQVLTKVRFPRSLPYLFSALKICAPLAVIGAMVGEWFGGGPGLGYLTIRAAGFRETSLMFTAIFLMSVIGVILSMGSTFSENLLLPWYKHEDVGQEG